MANDQQIALHQLGDAISQLRSEMVQTRQEAMRRLADEYQGVDEFAASIAAGGTITSPALMSAPVMITSIVAYSSATTTKLVLRPGQAGIPLPVGITTLSNIKLLYRGNERPSLVDSGTTATTILNVMGYAVPSRAEPL